MWIAMAQPRLLSREGLSHALLTWQKARLKLLLDKRTLKKTEAQSSSSVGQGQQVCVVLSDQLRTMQCPHVEEERH